MSICDGIKEKEITGMAEPKFPHLVIPLLDSLVPDLHPCPPNTILH